LAFHLFFQEPPRFSAGVFQRAILAALDGPAPPRLIICEPFVLPVPDDRLTWREDLDPKTAVVRCLAREFQAVLVPLDGIFAQAATRREPGFWAPDGVHPSVAGEALMAQAWLRAVKAI
jgi:acyl-CoA thioesterase-1